MFTYQHKIKLHETDAAGIIFFSHQFEIIHDAYEALLESIGFGFPEMLNNRDFFLPIVHAESDYKAPISVGDLLEIQVKVESVGKTSFSFAYTLLKADQTVVGTAKTVHVTIDKQTRQKIPVPQDMLTKINELYAQNS